MTIQTNLKNKRGFRQTQSAENNNTLLLRHRYRVYSATQRA